MYLNGCLLFEELQKVFPVRRTGPVVRDEYLNPPLFYRPGMQLDPNQIYIGQGSQFEAAPPERSCVISVGEPPACVLDSQAECIVAEEPLEVSELFNQVQIIFETFRHWELQMEALAQHDTGIQEILDRSQPFFSGNFFLMLDANYRVMATTGEPGYVMDQTGCTPYSVQTRFKKDPEYTRMRYHRETFLYRGLYFDHDILTHHIFINDELCGTFTLTEKESPITDGRWTLFNRLARIVTGFYRQRFYLLHSAALPPAAAFSHLLNGEMVSALELGRSLKSVGWEPDDEYAACCIAVHESDKKIRSASYLCQQLESVLVFALAVEYRTDIVVVLNRSRYASKAEQTGGHSRGAFRSFLVETMLQAGISRPFRGLMQLKNYYQQARAALRVGARVSPDCPVYQFNDYLMDYMLGNIPGGIEVDSLCPEGLLAMREWDRKKGASYLQTLDTYFRTGCNATRSARELYINRSTFLERMARIRKLLGADPEDYDTRLYLMICLRLMEW